VRRDPSGVGWLGLLLALFGLLGLGCASPSAESEAPRAPLDANAARPLFWRVEAPSKSILYLLGSVHMGPAEGWRYPATIVEAFDASSRLIVEADVRALSLERQQLLLAEYGMLRSPQTLQSKLSEQTWALLVEELTESQIDLAAVERMQPWLVSNLLVLDAARRTGLSPTNGVDQDFLSRAGAREVVALESVEFQMSLLSGMSDPLQEIALLDMLGHADDTEIYLRRLVEAWRTGDETALSELIFEVLLENPEFAPYFEAVIFERNRTMAAGMAGVLEDPDHAGEASFAVVGAGHLIGDRSIGAALAERGYRVERIEPFAGDGVEIAVDR